MQPPTDPQTTRLVGWKSASLVIHLGEDGGLAGFAWMPTVAQVPYHNDDELRCVHKHSPTHRRSGGELAIDGACICGFYAYREREQAENSFYRTSFGRGALALLQVSLYGDVVEGSNGWRGTHQRVEAVIFGDRCGICENKAEGVQADSRPLHVWFNGEAVIGVQLICRSCVGDGVNWWSFDDLERELGVPVETREEEETTLTEIQRSIRNIKRRSEELVEKSVVASHNLIVESAQLSRYWLVLASVMAASAVLFAAASSYLTAGVLAALATTSSMQYLDSRKEYRQEKARWEKEHPKHDWDQLTAEWREEKKQGRKKRHQKETN